MANVYAQLLFLRIHIKKDHEGVEPKANVDPENFCSADEFVCLICIKKYKQRRLLKNHIMRVHFGVENETETTTEEVKIVEVEDPLGDPLAADSENDPLNNSLPEGEKEAADCDIIEIKDVEVIKANGNGDFLTKKPDDSPKPVTIPLQPKPLSDTEKVCKQNSLYLINLFCSGSAEQNAP